MGCYGEVWGTREWVFVAGTLPWRGGVLLQVASPHTSFVLRALFYMRVELGAVPSDGTLFNICLMFSGGVACRLLKETGG